MSVSAQATEWGIALQPAKVGDDAFNTASLDWYRYRVPTVTGGGMQDQATLPLELGGIITPTGGYKSGAYFVQEVDIIPRLENTFGWLLLATLGNVSSITGQKFGASGWATNTGATGHLFTFKPTDSAYLPWLSARMKVPGATSDQIRGILGYDLKASGFRFNVPGAGLITGRFGVQGRVPMMPNNTNTLAWQWENNFEGSDTIAHAGKGNLTIGSSTPKVTGLTVDFVNSLSSPQDEFIVGSFYPDDVVALTRAVRMRASMKWEDSTVWSLLMNGGATTEEWSSLPYFSETLGGTRGFYFEAQSPSNIPSTNIPYAIRVMADNVMMSYDPNSLRLRAGGIIEYVVNIDVLQPDDPAQPYVMVALDNAVTSYTAPSP